MTKNGILRLFTKPSKLTRQVFACSLKVIVKYSFLEILNIITMSSNCNTFDMSLVIVLYSREKIEIAPPRFRLKCNPLFTVSSVKSFD